MKVKFFILIFFILAANLLAEGSKDKIIIKLKSDSKQFLLWDKNNRSGEITELLPFIGSHSTRPYLSSSLIYALALKEKRNDRTLSNTTYDNSISNIVVINLNNSIDPFMITKKLSALPWIDYAEPMPVHRIFEMPNDPKTNGQYYLDTIYAYAAWDLIDTTKSIVVGVIDTGIDYEHEDIIQNMFINPGEDGKDSADTDRRSNGKDDDNNGFIDDWHGWDFSSSDSSGQDNNPSPGHKHGTHVGGTIGATTNNALGIASVGRFIKLMAVKASGDNPLNTSVDNGYEAILYAALAGAKVINCSWGSATKSEAEEEIIIKAIELGALIVAAAGNNNSHETFYPAGYPGVVSVAALNSVNQKASFSNFSETVDVSAPGDDILATVPNNSYEFMSGTSMASPVVAGVAALARIANPEYTPKQLHELLKATCDNIYDINSYFKGKLGKGKINAVKAVSANTARSVVLNNYKIIDGNQDGIFEKNEEVQIITSFENVLSSVTNVKVKATIDNFPAISIVNSLLSIGNMQTGDIFNNPANISFAIPNDIGFDEEFRIIFEITDSLGSLNEESISFVANPSYRTIDKNNIKVTVNSFGNLGYNDYPTNLQGDGYRFKNSQNMLFEGALIVGSGYGKLSNVARGMDQMSPDRDFLSTIFLSLDTLNPKADIIANSYYYDTRDTNRAGVEVTQKVFQSSKEKYKNLILTSYDLRNQTFEFFDSLYVGLFFDWDIGPSGADNQSDFDKDYKFGFISNKHIDTLPMTGVAVVSDNRINYYAIDNGGSSGENSINIYNGFTPREKWLSLTSGLTRTASGITDASMVMAAGPIKLLPSDTTRVTFAIFSGYSIEDLRKEFVNSIELAEDLGILKSGYPLLPEENTITKLYPNPTSNGFLKVEYTIIDNSYTFFELYDSIGRLVWSQPADLKITKGRHEFYVSTTGLSSGIYYLLLKSSANTQFSAFCITN